MLKELHLMFAWYGYLFFDLRHLLFLFQSFKHKSTHHPEDSVILLESFDILEDAKDGCHALLVVGLPWEAEVAQYPIIFKNLLWMHDFFKIMVISFCEICYGLLILSSKNHCFWQKLLNILSSFCVRIADSVVFGLWFDVGQTFSDKVKGWFVVWVLWRVCQEHVFIGFMILK